MRTLGFKKQKNEISLLPHPLPPSCQKPNRHTFLYSSEINNFEVYGEQNLGPVAWTRSSKKLNGSSFNT